MRGLVLALGAVSMLPLAACSDGRYGSSPGYYPAGQQTGYVDNGSYDAAHYYRNGSNYRERRLGRNDRVYRGSDGRYYCKRNDGTTGLIVGALAGGVLGNVIAPSGSGLLGTLLGAAGGGAIGTAVDKGQAKCR